MNSVAFFRPVTLTTVFFYKFCNKDRQFCLSFDNNSRQETEVFSEEKWKDRFLDFHCIYYYSMIGTFAMFHETESLKLILGSKSNKDKFF